MLLRESNSTQLLDWMPSFLEGLVSFYYIISINVFLISMFCRESSFILVQCIYVNILILCLWCSQEMYIEIHRCIERYPSAWAVSIFLKDALWKCSQFLLLNNYTSNNIIPKTPVLSNSGSSNKLNISIGFWSHTLVIYKKQKYPLIVNDQYHLWDRQIWKNFYPNFSQILIMIIFVYFIFNSKLKYIYILN